MAAVTIIGMGGLGCPAALSLAEGGVERLVIADPDRVEVSNLQRQVLYQTEDIGHLKVEVAAARLTRMVPEIDVVPVPFRVTRDNVDEYIVDADVIIDGTDDPELGFWLGDLGLARGVPVVLGGILRFQGLVLAVAGEHGPCYRCLFETPPTPDETPTCGQAGVLGALAGVVGHLQALRALGILAGETARHTGFVTTVDGLTGTIREVPLPEATECPACGGIRSHLDITGDTCPITYARTRLALEAMEPGDLLDVTMRLGEPAHNVPRSLTEEGHHILCQGPVHGERYRVVVRRAAL
jgi:molybdopterin/thiamine biosynthesis adenylyltransferase/TusA-related sulfurtransferase